MTMTRNTAFERADAHQLQVKNLEDCGRALELAMASGGLLILEKDISANCFDLASGILGDLFQKFVNYNLKLAIVIAEPGAYGPRIVELIRDHRNHRNVRFFIEEISAQQWLSD